MANRIQIVAMMSLVMFGATAMADLGQKKEVTRIDFNKMIDENNSERADLQREIVKKDETKTEEKVSDAEKKKVYDFVDMEVSSGKARPVVDRRFNSVSEARVVDIAPVTMTVQLIRKHK